MDIALSSPIGAWNHTFCPQQQLSPLCGSGSSLLESVLDLSPRTVKHWVKNAVALLPYLNSLSSGCLYPRIYLLRRVTRKHYHRNIMLPLCARERITLQPFDCKDNRTPSVEWPTFINQFLWGLYPHPFGFSFHEELLKMSMAHWDFGGRALWKRNPILYLLYVTVALGMLGENGYHFSQENCDYWPVGFVTTS